MTGYLSNIDAARKRLADRERRVLRHPRFGAIEYTEWGEGPAMLLSHPLLGGFDMMTGFAETYIGAGHRFAAPSRFGYLGSSLPPAAMPADQADAYAVLLDSLGIGRATVFGYSGRRPVGDPVRAPPRRAHHRADPHGLRPAGQGRRAPEGPSTSVLRIGPTVLDPEVQRALPLHANPRDAPRLSPDTKGARAYRADHGQPVPGPPAQAGSAVRPVRVESDVQTYALEEISVPTLIINAKDDGLSAFDNAARASTRIRGSKLMAIDQGGHLLLGSETRIQERDSGVRRVGRVYREADPAGMRLPSRGCNQNLYGIPSARAHTWSRLSMKIYSTTRSFRSMSGSVTHQANPPIAINPVLADRAGDFEDWLRTVLVPATTDHRTELLDRWEVLRAAKEEDGQMIFTFLFYGGEAAEWQMELVQAGEGGLDVHRLACRLETVMQAAHDAPHREWHLCPRSK